MYSDEVVCLWQVRTLVSRSSLFYAVTSATSWSKSTFRRCWLWSCRGCRSGSASTPVRRECRSACSPCWRRPRWAAVRGRLCRECPTSKQSTSGWSSVSCSFSRLWSSTLSSTCWLDARRDRASIVEARAVVKTRRPASPSPPSQPRPPLPSQRPPASSLYSRSVGYVSTAQSCCTGYWYWYLWESTCCQDKVIFCCNWHTLASVCTLRLLSVSTTGFMSKFHRLALFGGFAFHKFFGLSVFIKCVINYTSDTLCRIT